VDFLITVCADQVLEVVAKIAQELAGSFGCGPDRPFRRVILEQEAPACGHTAVLMALHETPEPELRLYR
ncbi:MAG: hypothetical protein IKA32_06855, partial [Lentisphaeria bacterium]|nr:hypothetical protein [Lentisphaeria bacterium]